MGERIPKEREYRLNALFDALNIVADGTYVFLCDMKYDYSRWSKSAVEKFALPGEYMSGAGDIWKRLIEANIMKTKTKTTSERCAMKVVFFTLLLYNNHSKKPHPTVVGCG